MKMALAIFLKKTFKTCNKGHDLKLEQQWLEHA